MIASLYDNFKRWSEKGSVWIISDTHFNDSDCKFMDPDWMSPDEHVALINKYVMPTDTLIHLGDVGDIEYAKKLRGHKVLIMGNHDAGKKHYEGVFDEIYEGPLFIGEKIVLSHEPIRVPFALNIHGHDHAGMETECDSCAHLRGKVDPPEGTAFSELKKPVTGYMILTPFANIACDVCRHINLAANVCGYKPVNLGNLIKNGALSGIESIHRMTIDRATEKNKEENTDVK